MNTTRYVFAATMGLALLLLAACSSPPKRDDMQKLQSLSRDRYGVEVRSRSTDSADAEIRKVVKETLAKELSIDGAVKVALLNNGELQASFERLGAAAADVWQAGLLKNPTLVLSPRFSLQSGTPTIESGIDLNLLDYFMRAARKRMAEAEALQVQHSAAQAIQNLAFETRAAYVALQTGLHKFSIEKLNFETAEDSITMHRRLHAAGNISDLDLAVEEANFSEIRVALQHAEIEVRLLRENLNRLMGLWGAETTWKIPETVASIPVAEQNLTGLENKALENRFDIKAMQAGLDFYREQLHAEKSVRWVPQLDFGVDAAFEEDAYKIGPHIQYEIPIFDRGDARIEKTVSLYRMRLRELENLAVHIRADVRVARDKMIAARQRILFYHKQILPQRERATQLMQTQYNAMLAGIFHLIAARQNELKAEKEYLDAHREYYTARAELERATGVKLEK
jgi:outer membrane protein, heavy metal efflux system